MLHREVDLNASFIFSRGFASRSTLLLTLIIILLWKAAGLTPLGSVLTGAGTTPNGACSDGLNFWITLNETDQLARF
jgi:hypothetical protein